MSVPRGTSRIGVESSMSEATAGAGAGAGAGAAASGSGVGTGEGAACAGSRKNVPLDSVLEDIAAFRSEIFRCAWKK